MILAEVEINPNMIIVFVAMIIAAIKALIEKRAQQNQPPLEEDTSEYEELYEAYEAELEAQRRQLEIPVPTAPPPMPTQVSIPAPAPTPARQKVVKAPVLSAAEEEALARFNSRSGELPRKKTTLSTKARVKAHLSSPTAAREALLLAEILGPPKAFK